MNPFRRDRGFDAPVPTASRSKRGAGSARGGDRGSRRGNERFGRWTESIARGMGTPGFLLILTIVCAAWLFWNTIAPENMRFDSAALGFTALTLILSLQASYAAPLLLLAQNRQDDRDRVQIEQDRQRAERNLADTEFLAREVVALRIALKDLPDREFVRNEIRALLTELEQEDAGQGDARGDATDSLGADRGPELPSGAEPGGAEVAGAGQAGAGQASTEQASTEQASTEQE